MKKPNQNIKKYRRIPVDSLSMAQKDELILALLEVNEKLEKALDTTAESHSKYKSLFEMSDDALLVIENYQFIDCNQAVVNMLGYKSKEELLVTHPSELSPEKQPDGQLSFAKAQQMMDIALAKGSNHFEWIHTRANGENFPVEVWLSKVKYGDRILLNTIWRDLTEKKKAESLILKNIKEKEVLLKEIHHRVKNNLQIIISLLNLQSNLIEDEKVKMILSQSKFRIESMSKVHELLYGSTSFSEIGFDKYLKELVGTLIKNFSSKTKISLKLHANQLLLNLNIAIPLGLLINELVTNTLKYAFNGLSSGEIVIELSLNNKKYELIYKDNGVGYSYDFQPENTPTLGFQLISSLTEQLEGNFKREKVSQGTMYRLVF